MNKRSIFILIAALIPLGCATTDARWDSCEKGAKTFVELADCSTRAVHADTARWSQPALRMRSEARAKRYALTADDLIEKVGTGRLSEAEGRAELERAMHDLLDVERDDRLVLPRQAPKSMTCSPVGTSVSCTQN